MHVTHLETCTVTRQTAGTECRHTTLVGYLGKRVGLIHKLRQGIRPEERVDDRRYGLRIDKVYRCEHLIVTHVHTFPYGTGHPRETYRELVGQLFAHSSHTSVAQVVYIIYIRLRVDKFYKIFDDFYYIFFSKNFHIHACCQAEFLIYTITAHIAQVISFFREEQIVYDFSGRSIVSRVCIAQLPVYVQYRFFLRVARVFLQSIVYYGVIGRVSFILVHKYIGNARFKYFVYMVSFKYRFAINQHLISFDRNDFTGIFIHEVFHP